MLDCIKTALLDGILCFPTVFMPPMVSLVHSQCSINDGWVNAWRAEYTHTRKNELIAFFPDKCAMSPPEMLYMAGSPPSLLCMEVLMEEGTMGL